MASPPATGRSGKTVAEVEHGGRGGGEGSPVVNFFHADFSLRVLLFASSLTALIVLVTSEQTKVITVPTGLPLPAPPFISLPRPAKFQHSPAFIYLLAALSVTCFYSAITLLTSAYAIRSSSPSTKLLFNLVIFDALMVGVLAAATGAGGAIAYLGLKGDDHVQWNKVCNVYGKFCRHIAGSVAVTLFASIILVALVVLSAYSLYRRTSRR